MSNPPPRATALMERRAREKPSISLEDCDDELTHRTLVTVLDQASQSSESEQSPSPDAGDGSALISGCSPSWAIPSSPAAKRVDIPPCEGGLWIVRASGEVVEARSPKGRWSAGSLRLLPVTGIDDTGEVIGGPTAIRTPRASAASTCDDGTIASVSDAALHECGEGRMGPKEGGPIKAGPIKAGPEARATVAVAAEDHSIRLISTTAV